jgi:hypothetical protein
MKTTKFITGLFLCGSIFTACNTDDDQCRERNPAKNFSVSQNSDFPVIAKTGGETTVISVDADPSYHWSATVSMSSGTASDGRTLMNHTAYLVDENGNEITGIQSVTTPFRVVLPKVYWPNREISGITATVTVTLHDAAGNPTPLTQTISVTQNPLISAGTVAHSMQIQTGNGGSMSAGQWGALYCTTYNGHYVNAVLANFTRNNGAPEANTSYLHAFSYGLTNLANGAPGWTLTGNFRREKDAVTVLALVGGNLAQMNMPGMTPNVLGFTIVASSKTNSTSGRLETNSANTKIYRFLVTDGKSAITNPATLTFYMDPTSTAASVIPSTAVSIIKNGNNGNSILAIDATQKTIYIGEPQALGYNFGWTANPGRQALLDNLMLYIRNAAEYGSHFTDLLNDSLPNNVPDLWDTAWGDNAKYK